MGLMYSFSNPALWSIPPECIYYTSQPCELLDFITYVTKYLELDFSSGTTEE